jgi:hypothetical protein
MYRTSSFALSYLFSCFVVCLFLSLAQAQVTDRLVMPNLSGDEGSWQRFTFEVPAGASRLSVTTSGGTGDVDLYVRYNVQPETDEGQFDCRPFTGGNDETCEINNPQAGTWHIGLNAYAAYTDVTLEAVWTPGDTTGGMFEQMVSGNAGIWSYFKIEIPEGTVALNVEISGGTGDADLYLRYNEQPDKSNYDCRPYLAGNVETCTTPNPQAGIWHIGIHAFSDYNDAMLNAFWTIGGPPPGGPDEFAQARQACVDRINAFRETLGLTPLERWTDNETCTDQQSEQDATSGQAHGAFGICNESGQNTCPGWPSTDAIVTDCLQQMWDEGPPPILPCEGECFQQHGHFLNMSSTAFTKVACGFYRTNDGSIWSNHNYR